MALGFTVFWVARFQNFILSAALSITVVGLIFSGNFGNLLHDRRYMAFRGDFSSHQHHVFVTRQETQDLTNQTSVNVSIVAVFNHHLHQSWSPSKDTLNLTSILSSMPLGDILFSYGNADHLQFQLHWICNTAGWQGVHERTLLVTTDATSASTIHSLNSVVTTYVVPANARTHGFYSKGYRRLTIQRVAILVDILKSGRGVIMFEGDAVWTRNVLEDRNLSDPNRVQDISVYRDGPNGENIGAGFMSMKGNRSAALTMWQRVLDRMNNDMNKFEGMPDSTTIPISTMHEQEILAKIVLPAMLRNGEIRVLNLDRCLYASGLWYKFKTKYITMCGTKMPTVLNNNYIIGNHKKIDRARKYKHWFLEGEKCGDWKKTLAAVGATFRSP